MSLKITTLIENSQGEHLGLKTEHGLSFFIEKDGLHLLFDTGESEAFLYNADRMNIDMQKIEKVVLSHGHYDHTGGLLPLSGVCSGFELLIGEGFFDEKYGYKNNSYQYLGNNFTENDLIKNKINYKFIKNRKTEIGKGVYLITNFNRDNKDEIINPRFKIFKDGHFISDPFNDEVLVAIETPKGIFVIVGCSHPGIKNMLDTVAMEFNQPVCAVLGGTHLVEASDESLKKSIAYFSRDNFEILGVSHCTGKNGMSNLEHLGSFFQNSTGSMIYMEF